MQGVLFDKVKILYANGNSYEGETSNFQPNSIGIMTYTNGNVYEGVWAYGYPILGQMTYKNGEIYSGQWD